MTARVTQVDDFDLVVFGATGDLSQRKLLPALFQRDAQGQIPQTARIIGTSRRSMDANAFRTFAKAAVEANVASADRPEEILQRFLGRLAYVMVEATQTAGWTNLETLLGSRQDRIRIFYLAVGPDLFGPICERLGAHKLVTPLSRVVVEKPLGVSAASAKATNDAVGKVFSEPAIFRIDHYLGKETVQNLLALRFANALFEPLWNSAHIDHVQITVAETLGVGSRAAYYDTAGALRDMVQSHLLQLLCLVAMEPPRSIDGDAIRDEKLKVLRSLKPIGKKTVDRDAVRGQYSAGEMDGKPVAGYLEELGSAQSKTETFVAIKTGISSWRWNGVPFYLRTGKRLGTQVSDIIIAFRSVPHNIFGASAGALDNNRLILRLQPDEGVKLWLMIKEPGPGLMRLKHVPLDMTFAEAFGGRNPGAYERLLMDVVRGDQTLFMRRDEVETAWGWIDSILDAWKSSTTAPQTYPPGSWGPPPAATLIERDGRSWYEDHHP
jgi:glucose-6-phosphate 1-dehydrogenase